MTPAEFQVRADRLRLDWQWFANRLEVSERTARRFYTQGPSPAAIDALIDREDEIADQVETTVSQVEALMGEHGAPESVDLPTFYDDKAAMRSQGMTAAQHRAVVGMIREQLEAIEAPYSIRWEVVE